MVVAPCLEESGPPLLKVVFKACSFLNSFSYKHYHNPRNERFVLGMAFGTGSAMAHRAVDAVMGPRTIQHETVVSEAAAAAPAAPAMNADACSIHSKAFQDVCVLTTFMLPSFSSVWCIMNLLIYGPYLLFQHISSVKYFCYYWVSLFLADVCSNVFVTVNFLRH